MPRQYPDEHDDTANEDYHGKKQYVRVVVWGLIVHMAGRFKSLRGNPKRRSFEITPKRTTVFYAGL
jgi:hypothetical protein